MTVIWMVQWLYLLISKVNLQILLTKMFFAHHKAKHFLMVSFFKKKKKKKHKQNQLKCSKQNEQCLVYQIWYKKYLLSKWCTHTFNFLAIIWCVRLNRESLSICNLWAFFSQHTLCEAFTVMLWNIITLFPTQLFRSTLHSKHVESKLTLARTVRWLLPLKNKTWLESYLQN